MTISRDDIYIFFFLGNQSETLDRRILKEATHRWIDIRDSFHDNLIPFFYYKEN